MSAADLPRSLEPDPSPHETDNVIGVSASPRVGKPRPGRRALVRDAWFVYLARCSDGTLYTGIARDVAARIAAHDAGRGARYTRGRGPLTVCAVRRCPSKGAALRLELAVKRLTRAAKEALTQGRRLGVLARRCET